MKKILIVFSLFALTMFFSGCTMTKHVAYFQNLDSIDISSTKQLSEIKIKPNDELTILVSSITPEAAEPFNMNLSTRMSSQTLNTSAGRGLYNYIVDNEGYINFPVIGKINLVGLTRPEAEAFITEKIKPYFTEEENPVVKVRYNSFRVTIIGEVGGSRVINVENERISIIEALAQAGDLSVYGKRPNVLLVREDGNGEKMCARFNLNDARVFNSPYYYLQQNDIIYVEPHKAKARSADVSSYTFWTPLSSLALSLATFIMSITK